MIPEDYLLNELKMYTLLFQVSGYLNLLANSIDNFTHGLAVAGSFLISPKVRNEIKYLINFSLSLQIQYLYIVCHLVNIHHFEK